jgi:hypothetical protein
LWGGIKRKIGLKKEIEKEKEKIKKIRKKKKKKIGGKEKG